MNYNIALDDIIMEAVKVAIKEYDKEKSLNNKDKRLHNTKLLMKNYNKLKKHIDAVKATIEFEIDGVEDKIWLTSIARTKMRTMKMIAYIDSALGILEKKCKKDCSEYKYKAFKMYYIKENTNEEIIEELKCGKNQPKIWSDSILKDLSTLLWGIEALGI